MTISWTFKEDIYIYSGAEFYVYQYIFFLLTAFSFLMHGKKFNYKREAYLQKMNSQCLNA